jgi:hypothetical protein
MIASHNIQDFLFLKEFQGCGTHFALSMIQRNPLLESQSTVLKLLKYKVAKTSKTK